MANYITVRLNQGDIQSEWVKIDSFIAPKHSTLVGLNVSTKFAYPAILAISVNKETIIYEVSFTGPSRFPNKRNHIAIHIPLYMTPELKPMSELFVRVSWRQIILPTYFRVKAYIWSWEE